MELTELPLIVTVAWIALPFFVGFSIYLLPQFDRILALSVALISVIYASLLFIVRSPQTLELIDNFGVMLIADPLSGFFILTNALVTLAVLIYCWRSEKTAFFFTQIILLHGSVNAAFLCADFISLYVALEVISIASFLLMTYSRSSRSIWVGLRYLFVSNTAMLFYLVGVALVYQATHSFRFQGLSAAPPEAITLIFLGLLVKGGIFVSGLWLPQTHAEAETPVSAMLSGVVVKTSVLALVRCALLVPEVEPIVRLAGVGTALLGVVFIMFETDSKRLLAFSTMSQLGFILAAPPVAGFYALTHGLVKAALFLVAGSLPSRNFKELNQQPIARSLWLMGAIAAFSISGLPLLAGFGAKTLTMKALLPWQVIAMNIAATGTAIAFAKFIFLPHSNAIKAPEKVKLLWLPITILIGGLFVTNLFYPDAYSLGNIAKAIGTTLLGWLLYLGIIKKLSFKFSRIPEQLEHLIGVMSLSAIGLFLLAMYVNSFEGVG
ncbi:MAG: cation:proton antiporter [Coleofasciculaceae cyanobacterium RL_1_1]|nr:cation:proton antiporter [Coleofasciculaceae cyanobacterium RL_1_1]